MQWSLSIFPENIRKCLFFCVFRGYKKSSLISFSPASINLLKVSNKNTRKICEICSKLTMKTPDVIDAVLVSLLLTLNGFRTFFWCFYCWTRKCQYVPQVTSSKGFIFDTYSISKKLGEICWFIPKIKIVLFSSRPNFFI